ncbi:MAG TPA: hypothetical protein DCS43_05420 [Verrucomicrobia bacterium]|nr:hypothetical protein [Verrucomicrobiota bacterium]
MKSPHRRLGRVGLAVSTVLLLASLAWTTSLLVREAGVRRTLRQQQVRMERLAPLEADADALDKLRLAFEADGTAIMPLARELFGEDDGLDIVIKTETNAVGLLIHTVTLDDENVPYDTLTACILKAESLRPPLKLVDCVLEPAPGKTGEGRARLAFERIEWRK